MTDCIKFERFSSEWIIILNPNNLLTRFNIKTCDGNNVLNYKIEDLVVIDKQISDAEYNKKFTNDIPAHADSLLQMGDKDKSSPDNNL